MADDCFEAVSAWGIPILSVQYPSQLNIGIMGAKGQINVTPNYCYESRKVLVKI
jgi:hypothetical protein